MWYWILAWLLTVLTVIGNGLVICLIISNRSLHTKPNWSVFSLALADLGVGLTFFPLLFALNVNNLDGPPETNRTFFLVSRTFLYLSATNLFVMILDRYVAIVHPLKYLNVMRTRIIVMSLALAWFAPIFIFSLPFALNFKDNRKFLLVFRVILFQLLPILIFVHVTYRIFLIMRRISKRTSRIFAQLAFNHAPKSSTGEIYSGIESKAASKMTVAIIFFFVVCYVIENYKCFCVVFEMCLVSPSLQQVIDLLFVINSAANPIAYAFLKRDIKTTFLRLFARQKRQISSAKGTDASSSEHRKELSLSVL